MTQKKYALELLECANVLDIKPIATPMDTTIKLNDSDDYLLSDPSTYKTLVGKPLYLTITRPDFSFAAQALSQYSHSPRSSHYDALLRVLRYIKLCPSKKQTMVSRSSTEAEYRALVDNTCEISWLKYLLLDLRVHVLTPSLFMCDNASTIALANNPIHHARTKHIEIDCHFEKKKIRQGQISPCCVPTKHQIADTFTKGLCSVVTCSKKKRRQKALQHLPFSPATIPGNPRRFVAGDGFPGRHVAREKSNGKARMGYLPGRQRQAHIFQSNN
nr:uncharacterized mitochondrial protein AtMg00810-like [Tanacetum cinerariifolium]